MFDFFKKKSRLATYEQPVLIASSMLPGFLQFVSRDTGTGIPWMKVVDEDEIPYGELYFNYIGNGKCKRSMKHDPVPTGAMESKLSLDLRNRVNDHAFSVNHFGTEYTQTEMFTVCFYLRKEF
jgi:hypothetical protein